MAGGLVTERQGAKIIDLLGTIVSELNGIKSEVERLEGIEGELFKMRQRLNQHRVGREQGKRQGSGLQP